MDAPHIADPFDRYFEFLHGGESRMWKSPSKLAGVRVRIPFGITYRSTGPQGGGSIRRTTTVVIQDARPSFYDTSGYREYRRYVPAMVSWAGAGGYWKKVSLHEVEILDPVPGVQSPTADEVNAFLVRLREINAPHSVEAPSLYL